MSNEIETLACEVCGDLFTVEWQNGRPTNPEHVMMCNPCWVKKATQEFPESRHDVYNETSKIQTIKAIRLQYEVSLLDAKTSVDMFCYSYYGEWDAIHPNTFNDFIEKCMESTYHVDRFRLLQQQKYAALEVIREGFEARTKDLIHDLKFPNDKAF